MAVHFVRSAGVKEKPVGREVALYVEATRAIHVLNQTARFIWESLAEPMTRDELLFVLSEAFDTERDVLQKDLDETLARFTDVGLLSMREGDDGHALS